MTMLMSYYYMLIKGYIENLYMLYRVRLKK